MANKKLISVVIPAMNEEGSIGYLLDDLAVVIRETRDYEFEVIVVNDHSKDNTAAIAQSKNARVINNLKIPGKGHALISGFEVAKGDYIVIMDADYSHRAEDIPKLIQPLENGAGLTIGSRIYGGSSDEFVKIRTIGNIILTSIFAFLNKLCISDALNGFKAFRSEVVKSFKYTSKDFEIEIELLANALRLGMKIIEVPSNERCRRFGVLKSKTIKHGIKFLNRIILEWLRDYLLKIKKWINAFFAR